MRAIIDSLVQIAQFAAFVTNFRQVYLKVCQILAHPTVTEQYVRLT